MATYVITGSASGIGAATKSRLEAAGHRVVGVDLANSDVNTDLATPSGRQEAIRAITALAPDGIDGFAPFAGLSSATGRPGALLVSVNYFGVIEVLEGIRPLLARPETSSVVLISSNSTTSQPNWPIELAEACLAGDERAAVALADSLGELSCIPAYPATKAALAYYARTRSAEYIAQGIRLNAIAPGFIDTPMTRAGREDPLTRDGIEQFLASVPAGRAGRAEEVAALVDFLFGPESTFFVGSVVFVDGGTDAALRGKDWPQVWTL